MLGLSGSREDHAERRERARRGWACGTVGVRVAARRGGASAGDQRASRRGAPSRPPDAAASAGARAPRAGCASRRSGRRRCRCRRGWKFAAGNVCAGSSRRSKVTFNVTESVDATPWMRAGSVSRGAMSSWSVPRLRRDDAHGVRRLGAVLRAVAILVDRAADEVRARAERPDREAADANRPARGRRCCPA